jgi:predicted lipid-binding transport protein (Tim44 family)
LSQRRIAARAAAAAAIVASAAAWAPALARVGGGGGYSGGGGESGGGGGAGLVFVLIRLLLWLVIREPIIGIPLVIVVIIVVARMAKNGGLRFDVGEGPTTFTTASPGGAWTAPALRRGPANLTPVRSTDPFFSEPLFVDFAQLVYARAQEMRSTGRREPLAPWMAAEAIDKLFADRVNLESVAEVIFGATKIVQAATDGGFVLLDVAFEANLTEVRRGQSAQILCDERWTFRRKVGARSPGPERMRALGCPGCGSTAEPKTDGTCPSCGAPRRGGLAQWEVSGIPYANRRPLSAPELPAAGGVEAGTELPLVYDPRLASMKRAFEGKHPDHSWPDFDRRVREAFLAMQKAWTTQKWNDARPFETDALYQTHRFWLERYRAFGLVNHVDDVVVQRVVVVKIDSDAFYEAVTVRIFASARDWTEDKNGNVVSGNKGRPTIFSEYWTLLRAIGGAASAAPRTCPACAAPLESAGQVAVCPYCGSKLDLGTFDWVVSRIEQDDAYSG